MTGEAGDIRVFRIASVSFILIFFFGIAAKQKYTIAFHLKPISSAFFLYKQNLVPSLVAIRPEYLEFLKVEIVFSLCHYYLPFKRGLVLN